ncbi:MAG: DUF2116 family Zn-ribbon domain-containing protein [Candidatus Hadarchaeales archaeon]
MVEDHRHCVVCGKPVPPDKFICSPSCEEILRKQQKRYHRIQLYTMILFFLLFVLILVISVVKGSS